MRETDGMRLSVYEATSYLLHMALKPFIEHVVPCCSALLERASAIYIMRYMKAEMQSCFTQE